MAVNGNTPAHISAAVAVSNAGDVVFDHAAVGKPHLRHLSEPLGRVEPTSFSFAVILHDLATGFGLLMPSALAHFLVSLAAVFAVHRGMRCVFEQLEHGSAQRHDLFGGKFKLAVAEPHGHGAHLLQCARSDGLGAIGRHDESAGAHFVLDAVAGASAGAAHHSAFCEILGLLLRC